MKKLGILLAALAMLFGLSLAVPASASATSNGQHLQYIDCSHGGMDFTFWVQYTVSGIGSSSPNIARVDQVGWYTNPNTSTNRLSLYGLNDISMGEDYKLYEYGGDKDTPDDVPPSHTSSPNLQREYMFANGDPGYWSFNLWGGPGSLDFTKCTNNVQLN